MKINEKHLSSFATGTAAVDKQGFLSKRGELNRSFQRRWFVLKGNLLFYFDRRADAEPVGVIVIEGCSVELAENSENFSFELAFSGSGTRTYVLAADTQEEMEEWMRALTCAGYEYMRNAVSDLQRQLNELNAMSRQQQAASNTTASVLRDSNYPDCSGASAAARGASRLNPFNQNLDDPQDVFPTLTTSYEKQQRDARPLDRPRTFEEMHAQFGDHIASAVGTARLDNVVV